MTESHTTQHWQTACHAVAALQLTPGLFFEEDIVGAETPMDALDAAVSGVMELCLNVIAEHVGEDDWAEAVVEEATFLAGVLLKYAAAAAFIGGSTYEPDEALNVFIGGPMQECCTPGCEDWTTPGCVHCDACLVRSAR